jgi:glycosyltransferase involved in cell wall biosynthesis
VKIAFISYEYPPDAAYGGIATYVYQAARMLRARGHHVEVFTSSPQRDGSEIEDDILVHRIRETRQENFALPVGGLFAKRHATLRFDVLEGPEFLADAREAVKLVPDIPLVVKLHTPSIMLLELNYLETSTIKKVRHYINGMLRGVKPAWGYPAHVLGYRSQVLKADVIERTHAFDADEIVTPSKGLGKVLIEKWGLRSDVVACVPYPYTPGRNLLDIPTETYTNTITFIGRLEMRKGVLELARAIPLVLKQYPSARFRFVGSSEDSPVAHLAMQPYLERRLQDHKKSVEFTGAVAPDKIPEILAGTDICVFPSRWENFPCVCLETMAAARGIVGSSAGGMVEMLNHGQCGAVIPPGDAQSIAQALLAFLREPNRRVKLGQAARERLLVEYSVDRVGRLQEASYSRAIERRRSKGPRRAPESE